MIKIGVIGLGTIFEKQNTALQLLSDKFKIVAMCDINSEKISNVIDDTPFFQSVEELLQIKEIEAVLIATPPHTHYDLASAVIKAHKHVLLEKPAVLSMNRLNELYKQADDNKVLLQIAYHASFAADLEWYTENSEQIANTYKLGQLKEIKCGFFDPYMVDGDILDNKHMLGGSYIDSGVNELSVCDRLINLDGFQRVEHSKKDRDGVVHSSETKLKNGDLDILLVTGWDRMLNEKTTELSFFNTDKKILLDHSNQQAVVVDAKHSQVIFIDDKIERLVRHYMGVFKTFEEALSEEKDNRISSRKIHKLLLEE